jgi:4'-phosphopantetheinyl transferase
MPVEATCYDMGVKFQQLAPIHRLPRIEPSTAISLAPGGVDLWCFFYEEATRDAELCAAYGALMSDDERERHQRFVFERDRRLFLATRALVRTVLSRYAHGEPASWRFASGKHGKPSLASATDQPVYFNLSNTHGLVVCAVSRSPELGVDTESLGRRIETAAIAGRVFSPSELAALKAQPAAAQRERFFCYWTLKECYIKARGLGLAIPLAQFAFELDDGPRIGISFTEELGDTPSRWQFALLRASSEHLVAVGVDAPAPLELRATRFVPLREVSPFDQP